MRMYLICVYSFVCRKCLTSINNRYGAIERVTYLRMTENLMNNPSNWNIFCGFVTRMHAASSK